jgi:hypothetical protein
MHQHILATRLKGRRPSHTTETADDAIAQDIQHGHQTTPKERLGAAGYFAIRRLQNEPERQWLQDALRARSPHGRIARLVIFLQWVPEGFLPLKMACISAVGPLSVDFPGSLPVVEVIPSAEARSQAGVPASGMALGFLHSRDARRDLYFPRRRSSGDGEERMTPS